MKASTAALFYFVLGGVLLTFTYFSVSESSWSFWSILLAAFAAYDLVMGFNYLRLMSEQNKKK
ncbi:DUF4305 domain-containing protein [Marinococcus halotolerans]|uniref:DUF4305 domain-containing protein n=1 Tax=Marinococcus halotolerans TaxID=301092 RepID=UPI0003B35065|nr:DUF4305 domain-containing protein [Marinococcus halotolerans]